MDRDGFNNYTWGSQSSATGPAHAPAGRGGFDLNSQASATEVFPGLQLYGDILQGDSDELLPARVRSSGLPPYRPPRAGAGDARATPAAPYARQLHLGGSSSAPAGRGGGNSGSSSGAGGPIRQRTHSAAAAPGRRTQHTAAAAPGRRSRPPRKKPYLKKLLMGPPANEDLLDELWRGLTVDGTTAFVPGDDYGPDEEQDAGTEDEEEEFQTTPSRSSQRSQRGKMPLSSTTSTLTSPLKRTKSPMVNIVKDIATTFKESVAANAKQIQKRADDKAASSVKRCQELAFDCGVEATVDNVYAMSKMFATEFQRQFFCGELTPELRLGYFKKWCRDNLE